MARPLLTIMLALALLAVTWLREAPAPPNFDNVLTITPLDLPSQRQKGPFTLVGLWQLTSPNKVFGGYSALVRPSPGRLLALSDRGTTLAFSAPGASPGPVVFARVLPVNSPYQRNRDVESAAWHADSGRMWLGIEGRGTLVRMRPGRAAEVVRNMPEWRRWGSNTGPEAMVRLSDGRFVVLCECRSGWFDGVNHPAFVYHGDPAEGAAGQAFDFAGAEGYRPTDMAELPDGRVLVVMRRLVWPAPARFAVKLMLADPDRIAAGKVWTGTELADLGGPWPAENYEALAIEELGDGRIAAWIMSDENEAVSQRVLLLRLEFHLSDLPAKQKAPG